MISAILIQVIDIGDITTRPPRIAQPLRRNRKGNPLKETNTRNGIPKTYHALAKTVFEDPKAS